MATVELLRYLEDQAGEHLRGIARYERDSIDVPYLRDDLREVRMHSQVDRMLRRLRPESDSIEDAAFPFGDMHATVRLFDEAIIMHFPLGVGRGMVVAMEPETASRLNTFVSECLVRLDR